MKVYAMIGPENVVKLVKMLQRSRDPAMKDIGRQVREELGRWIGEVGLEIDGPDDEELGPDDEDQELIALDIESEDDEADHFDKAERRSGR